MAQKRCPYCKSYRLKKAGEGLLCEDCGYDSRYEHGMHLADI